MTFVPFALVLSLTPSLVAAPIGFDGPEVFKLDWNVRGLVAHDIDADGRTDLVLLNNDSTKIEILLQRLPDEIKSGGRVGPPVGM